MVPLLGSCEDLGALADRRRVRPKERWCRCAGGSSDHRSRRRGGVDRPPSSSDGDRWHAARRPHGVRPAPGRCAARHRAGRARRGPRRLRTSPRGDAAGRGHGARGRRRRQRRRDRPVPQLRREDRHARHQLRAIHDHPHQRRRPHHRRVEERRGAHALRRRSGRALGRRRRRHGAGAAERGPRSLGRPGGRHRRPLGRRAPHRDPGGIAAAPAHRRAAVAVVERPQPLRRRRRGARPGHRLPAHRRQPRAGAAAAGRARRAVHRPRSRRGAAAAGAAARPGGQPPGDAAHQRPRHRQLGPSRSPGGRAGAGRTGAERASAMQRVWPERPGAAGATSGKH